MSKYIVLVCLIFLSSCKRNEMYRSIGNYFIKLSGEEGSPALIEQSKSSYIETPIEYGIIEILSSGCKGGVELEGKSIRIDNGVEKVTPRNLKMNFISKISDRNTSVTLENAEKQLLRTGRGSRFVDRSNQHEVDFNYVKKSMPPVIIDKTEEIKLKLGAGGTLTEAEYNLSYVVHVREDNRIEIGIDYDIYTHHETFKNKEYKKYKIYALCKSIDEINEYNEKVANDEFVHDPLGKKIFGVWTEGGGI